MLVFAERGEPEYPEKNLGAEKRTNNKLNPHMTSSPQIEPGPHWWKASALTTAPSLLPELSSQVIFQLSVPWGIVPNDFSFAISVARWLWVVCELVVVAALVKRFLVR